MKKIYLFMLLTSVMLASCAKDTTVDVEPTDTNPNTIFATIEHSDNSRVQINEKVQTVWTEGDHITTMGPGIYSRYKFNGKTGDRAGSFELAENYIETKDAVMSRLNAHYAVYSTDDYIDYGTTTVENTSFAVATFPTVQTHVEGTYDPTANVMAGTSEDGKSFVFQNVSAYLRVSFTGTKIVKRLELQGNNEETIAGRTYFDLADINNPKFRWEVGSSKSIILECGDKGVQLSNEPTEFMFALIPTTFTKGFTVLVTFTDGTVFSITATKEIQLMRNHIRPMAVSGTEGSVDNSIYIYHKGEVVAMPQITGGASTTGTISWGDGGTALVGRSTADYVYQDGKPKHTITVQVTAAASMTMSHMVGVEKIDLSNF